MQKLLTYYGTNGIWIESDTATLGLLDNTVLDDVGLEFSECNVRVLEDNGFTVLTGDCGTKCYIELDCGTQASFNGVEWELIKAVNNVY